MVGVTAILGGYLANQFLPDTFSGTYNSPLFMFLFCIVFALGVAYIAFRGVNGCTGVNIAINVIQITALVVFSVIAIAYRLQHPRGLARLPPLQRHCRSITTSTQVNVSRTTRANPFRTPGRTASPRRTTKASRL